jgi:formylglycine-generating enzyme required for sulfatase activity
MNSVAYPWGEWPPALDAGNYYDVSAANEFNSRGVTNGSVAEDYNDGYVATAPVGSFGTNRFGLFDLGGNVWEWCQDRYDPESRGDERVLRGASWLSPFQHLLLSSYRYRRGPNFRHSSNGFRCVIEIHAGP